MDKKSHILSILTVLYCLTSMAIPSIAAEEIKGQCLGGEGYY